jgi:hypothetical protein
MFELGFYFILSQILMLFAVGLDFLSMQFKERKTIYFILAFSAAFISAHLFLLGKVTAGLIVFLSVLRFIVCMFSTHKKFLLTFIILNTLVLLFTYSEVYDFIIYLGLSIFIVGNFQENKKRMRQVMMLGTSLVISYYIFIFSPMAILAESIFLTSALLGYYRFYIRNEKSKKPLAPEAL